MNLREAKTQSFEVVDDTGRHRVVRAALWRMREEGNAELDRFYAALVWKPIADYDLDAASVVMVADDGEGAGVGVWFEDAWRSAVECDDLAPLTFTPTKFAEIADDWLVRMVAD